MILNLIDFNYSQVKYDLHRFPDGEPTLSIDLAETTFPEYFTEIIIKTRIVDMDDVLILGQACDILNRSKIPYRIEILYLLTQRMDRIMSYKKAFTLEVMCKMIRSFTRRDITILEPHSDVCLKLLDAKGIYRVPVSEYVVLPDKGAVKRYSGIEGAVNCDKIRDVDTGKLISINVCNPEIIKHNHDETFTILDDLCDAGGTFMWTAERLREINPDIHLNIYVTHMVNRVGIENLSKCFDNVYFTNSYKNWDNLPSNCHMIIL